MNIADRIALFESMLDTLLRNGRERAYVTFEAVGRPDDYVQYKLQRGRVCGEVGARQWRDPERPLRADAVDRLAALGFSGGGPERNHARDGLASSAAELAPLTESLFRAAYGLDDEFAVVVHLNLNDVTMPRAVHFTRHLIEAQLRERDVCYLKDQDGDIRADFNCAGSAEQVTVWFTADGDEGGVYRVQATGARRPVPATREQALERCNMWNREHRWPSAAVFDGEDGWSIVLNCNLDLTPGVTTALLGTFTDHAVCGALEFWEWIAAPDRTQTTASGEDEQ